MKASSVTLSAIVIIGFAASCASKLESSTTAEPRPRLVVVISIDQFRADYLHRFQHLYLPAKRGRDVGGFRFLEASGASYLDARYTHVPTVTAPGHATLLTGCGPALHGIVGNDWFDRNSNKNVYCVSEPQSNVIGDEGQPMGPANLKVTTLGDELKLATAGKAKVVAVSLKDRASILMGGHSADAAVWFHSKSGLLVSGSHYGESLPSWAQKMNSLKRPQSESKGYWEPHLEPTSYELSKRSPKEAAKNKVELFKHSLASATPDTGFDSWSRSPLSNGFILDLAREVVKEGQLGEDDITDILAINLAANDLVGHEYGPNSPEVLDLSVHTDRMLSRFFNDLDRSVKGGLKSIVIVVSADHGATPIVEEMREEYQIGAAKRLNPASVKDAVNAALKSAYGEANWVLGDVNSNLYLNRVEAEKRGISMLDVERSAANSALKVEGVLSAMTRTQILSGQIPPWPWAQRAAASFLPERCGDVVVTKAPSTYFSSASITGHGSAWIYDSQVPLLISGPGVRKGRFTRTVSMNDVAPSLAILLGITPPSGSVGEPLREALDR